MKISASTDIDNYIFKEKGSFSYALNNQINILSKLVSEYSEYQFSYCSQYRNFMENVGVKSYKHRQSLNSYDELIEEIARLPLIPTAAFKKTRIGVDHFDDKNDTILCKSSGTTGTAVSIVRRDRTTLERLIGSVEAGIQLIDSWHEDELQILNLGPDQDGSGNIWFPYVMSLTELVYPTKHYVGDHGFQEQELYLDILEYLKYFNHLGIVGPPFLILRFIEYLNKNGYSIPGGTRISILTAGGWKKYQGSAILRTEFMSIVKSAFQLESTTQIRDAFNQVELNTVFFECIAHRKHVPPWVAVVSRDPVSLLPIKDGQMGILSYIDTSALSYPSFILSDDLGVVERGKCSCGIEGTTIDVIRRINRSFSKGCALTIEHKLRNINESDA